MAALLFQYDYVPSGSDTKYVQAGTITRLYIKYWKDPHPHRAECFYAVVVADIPGSSVELARLVVDPPFYTVGRFGRWKPEPLPVGEPDKMYDNAQRLRDRIAEIMATRDSGIVDVRDIRRELGI